MAEEFESAIFYTDLDTIFDTRLAVLQGFGQDVVLKNLRSGYHERNTDEFIGVDRQAYEEAYEKRDESIFRNMMLTGAVDLIIDFAVKTLVALASTPLARQPKLLVNSYPYELSDDAIRAITMGLVAVTKKVISIELKYIPLEEITPTYVKQNFTTMCIYHYNKWIDVQSKNLAIKQCPQIALLAPEIYTSKEDLKVCGRQNPKGLVEAHFSPFIKLLLFPAAVFSVDFDRVVRNRIRETGMEPVMDNPSPEGNKREVVRK